MTLLAAGPAEDEGAAPDRGSEQSWRVVFNAVAAEIRDGRYPSGVRLPSEQEVAARFAVSRTTVRRALLALSQDGLIRIVNGSGSFPTVRHHTYTIEGSSRFRDTLAQHGVRVDHCCLLAEVIPADEIVAKNLGIPPGAEVSHLTSVMSGDGIPVVFSRRFYPRALCPDLVELYPTELSVTQILKRFGLGPLERHETSVSARLPTEEEATCLEMAPNAAILQIHSIGTIHSVGIAEYNRSIAPGSRLVLNFVANKQSTVTIS